MNARQLGTGLVILLALLSGCSKAKEPDKLPPPSPTASSDPSYGFDVAAQYTVEVVIPDGVHKQQIVLTIGRPGSLAEHLKAEPCPRVSASPQDVVIPYHISVTNIPSSSDHLVAASLSAALDARKFGKGAVFVQYSQGQICSLVWPSVGAAGQPLLKDKGISVWNTINDPTKRPDINDRGTIFIRPTDGSAPPPVESVFLQITPVNQTASIQYTITRMTSSVPARAGGRVTSGTNTGAYYVPLGDTTPCISFGNGVPMKCGTTLP